MSQPNPNYQRAKVFYEQKRYAEAEKYFLEALSFSPSDTTIFYELAWSQYLQKDRKKDALETIQKAISYDPNESHLHALASMILAELGKTKTALESAQRAVKLNPNDCLSFRALTFAYQEVRDWNEAEKAARQSLALDPDYIDAAVSLIFVLREQRKYFEARTLLKYWLSQHPNHAGLLEAKGELDFYTKKIQEAKVAFLDALRVNPQSEFAKEGLKQAHLAKFLPPKLAYWVLNFWRVLMVVIEILGVGIEFLFTLVLIAVQLMLIAFEVIVKVIINLFKNFLSFLRLK